MKFKFAALLCIHLFIIMTINAQYGLVFQLPGDQVNWNLAKAIADDGQGHTYLAGEFENTITFGAITLTTTPSDPGSFRRTGFIAKFDSATNTWLWAKKIAIPPASQVSFAWVEVKDITLDNAGNAYITGSYLGSVMFDNISLSSTKSGNTSTSDLFVAKITSGGNFNWAKSIGSKAGSDEGKTIEVDGSGSIFIGGTLTNKVLSCNGFSTDIYDIYLAKYSASGIQLWQKRFAPTFFSCSTKGYSNDLSLDAFGNIYLAGSYTGSYSFGSGSSFTISSSSATSDAYLAKINAAGTTVWVKSVGGTAMDEGNAVYADASGNVYLGGKMSPNTLIKFNGAGTILWSVNPYPFVPPDVIKSIVNIHPFQNYILVNDQYVGFKFVYDLDGSVILSDSLIGNGNSVNNYDTGIFKMSDVATAGTEYVFALNGKCGYTSIDDLSITATCSSACLYCSSFGDMIAVRKSETPILMMHPNYSGFESTVASKPRIDFDLFPNPACAEVTLVSPILEQSSLACVYDNIGNLLLHRVIKGDETATPFILNENQFPSGIYYFTFQSEGSILTKRILVTR